MGIVLREMREDDAPEVVRIIADPDVVRYTLFPPVSEEEVRAWFQASHRDSAESRKYRWWGIEDSGTKALAGFCGFVMEPQFEAGEAWYLLDRPWWGRGLGTQAARLLVEKGFREFGMHRVWAYVCPPNEASIRILEKLGLRREGLLRKNLKIQGQWMDSYVYAVLREEWEVQS
jgi:ribosomal-protein-alanine N-acetyltransferase